MTRATDRDRADCMATLGTVMNCLALQDFVKKACSKVETVGVLGPSASA